MGDRSNREYERYRVHLSVSFSAAADFVIEYAENLSRGGLFIVGAHQVEPLTEHEIDVDLPGFRRFRIKARAVHVLGPAQARNCGRKPGAGFQIIDAPPDFESALTSYLERLGRRRDAAVLVDNPACRALLESAGYRVRELPAPEEVTAHIARSEEPVVGIVVARHRAELYRSPVRAAGGGDLVVDYEALEELDAILSVLDEEL